MADKRMFNKKITESDAFLDMPMSAQCLYFHLNMSADDDGFVNSPRQIMRCVGASADDYNLLVAKSFIIEFDSGIIVIKHWRIHNYIQSDRYKPTVYEEEKAMLGLKSNNAYTLDMSQAIPIVKQKKELTDARQKRADAYKESELPSSFNNKITNAFIGKPCPICGTVMSYKYNTTRPTIQHNLPISLGGKHEIDNISVICQSCNCSIQNRTETPPYNTDEVKTMWECIGNVSIDKNSIDKPRTENNILSDKQKAQLADNMTPITLEVITYLNEKANTNFKPCTDKTKRCIKARVNEGFTLEDFKKVIDKKVNSWMGTEWQKYLRPETLFGTKFEGYLNETDVKPKGNSFNQMIHTNYDFDEIEKQILK